MTRKLKKTQPPLKVSVDNDEITVAMPGTINSITYRKRPNAEKLDPTRSSPPELVYSLEISEFRGRAFVAAVMKAKELGWLT